MSSRADFSDRLPESAERLSLINDFIHGEPNYIPVDSTQMAAHIPLSVDRGYVVFSQNPVNAGHPLPSPPSDAVDDDATDSRAFELDIKILAPVAVYNNITFFQSGANGEMRPYLTVPAHDPNPTSAATQIVTSEKLKTGPCTARPRGPRNPGQTWNDAPSTWRPLPPTPISRVAISPCKDVLPASMAPMAQKTVQKSPKTRQNYLFTFASRE
ncbi:unnamed protein product [Peniophora sp. CBMAI 1063]|nr:unnamed protein product [Peniophora sp. CBMAI 1063]